MEDARLWNTWWDSTRGLKHALLLYFSIHKHKTTGTSSHSWHIRADQEVVPSWPRFLSPSSFGGPSWSDCAAATFPGCTCPRKHACYSQKCTCESLQLSRRAMQNGYSFQELVKMETISVLPPADFEHFFLALLWKLGHGPSWAVANGKHHVEVLVRFGLFFSGHLYA